MSEGIHDQSMVSDKALLHLYLFVALMCVYALEVPFILQPGRVLLLPGWSMGPLEILTAYFSTTEFIKPSFPTPPIGKLGPNILDK